MTDPLLWDADAAQRHIYGLAGFDPDEPALIGHIAAGLGLAVQYADAPRFPGDAKLRGTTILVRRFLPLERKKFAVAHEVAEHYFRGQADAGLEDACNSVAAALIAPRRAFERAMRAFGPDDWEQLALPFGMTHTSSALRTAELRERSLVVVTPHRVYARGEWWGLTEGGLRTIARAARITIPGLRKTSLRDDPRRTVIIVEVDVETG